MLRLEEKNAEKWLHEKGWLSSQEPATVTRLTGGVSNDVLRVNCKHSSDFVLKQARPQLRVPEPWMCSVERIWRERDMLIATAGLLASEPADDHTAVVTPDLLHEDRDAYVIAISAAPRDNGNWKEHLLTQRIDTRIGAASGRLLAAIHANSWRDAGLQAQFFDRSFFDALRIDPFYLHIARRRPDLAPAFERLIQSVANNCVALVHGDFSPKNLLIGNGALMLVDFEVGHFGDPAFDLGFFLTHLSLKYALALGSESSSTARSMRDLLQAFCRSYVYRLSGAVDYPTLQSLTRRTQMHWAGCGLGRLDGKSQVGYLSPEMTPKLRVVFTSLLLGEPHWDELEVLSEATLDRIDQAVLGG